MEAVLYGIGVYALVKIIGYSLAGKVLNKWLHVSSPHAFVFGISRAGLGIVAGQIIFWTGRILDYNLDSSLLYILIIVRFFEWFFMLWLFYRKVTTKERMVKASIPLIIWSFILDIPVVFAMFSIPGGFRMC